jgi:hypothetical protein
MSHQLLADLASDSRKQYIAPKLAVNPPAAGFTVYRFQDFKESRENMPESVSVVSTRDASNTFWRFLAIVACLQQR